MNEEKLLFSLATPSIKMINLLLIKTWNPPVWCYIIIASLSTHPHIIYKYCLTKQNHYSSVPKHQGDSWKIQGSKYWMDTQHNSQDWCNNNDDDDSFNLQNSETLVWPTTKKEYATQKQLCPLNPTRMTHFYTDPNPTITWCSLNISLPHPSSSCFFFFFASSFPSFIKCNLIDLWITYLWGGHFLRKWHKWSCLPVNSR